MARDDGRRCAILLALLILAVAVATSLYRVYILTAVAPRLQVCDAKVGPYVYNPLNHTIQDLQLNVTLCWK